jgi:O-antigen/teichoic acid export membrane protein
VFGTAFSFATLATTVVDAGSITVLARTVAADGQGVKGSDQIWRTYWGLCVVRLAFASAVTLIALVCVTLIDDDYYFWFAVTALPASFIWAFNGAGLLDGLHRSGISGLSGAFPYLVSAVALVLTVSFDNASAGIALGASLSLGYAATVATQFVALHRLGHTPRQAWGNRTSLLRLAITSLQMLLTLLPGQIFFRFQLLLANAFLGVAGTALFLYAKQVAAALLQLVGFLRRTEFPKLVSRLSVEGARASILGAAWRVQRLGTLAGVLGMLAMLAFSGALALFGVGDLAKSAATVALFSPTVLTASLSMAATQTLVAIGAYGQAARGTLVSVCISALLSAWLVTQAGIAGMAVAEMAGSLLIVALVIRSLRAHQRSAV